MANFNPEEQLSIIQRSIDAGVPKEQLLSQFQTWDDDKKNRWFDAASAQLNVKGKQRGEFISDEEEFNPLAEAITESAEENTTLQAVRGFGEGVAETITFSLKDEILAGVDTIVNRVFDLAPESSGELSTSMFDEWKANLELRETTEKSKVEKGFETFGELAGFFLPVGAGMAAVKASKGARAAVMGGRVSAGFGRKVAAGLAEGAAFAGVYEGGKKVVQEVTSLATGKEADASLKDVGVGIGIASAVTGAFPVIGTAFRGSRKIVADWGGGFLKKIASKNLDDTSKFIYDKLDEIAKAQVAGKGAGEITALKAQLDDMIAIKRKELSKLSAGSEEAFTKQYTKVMDEFADRTAKNINENSLNLSQIQDDLLHLKSFSESSFKSTSEAYSQKIAHVLEKNKNTRITGMKSVFERLQSDLKNGSFLDDKGKIVKANIAGLPKEFQKTLEGIAKMFEAGATAKELSFASGNKLKKLLWQLHIRGSNTRNLYTEVRNKLVSSDVLKKEGLPSTFEEASAGYTKAMEAIRVLNRGVNARTKGVSDPDDIVRALFNTVKAQGVKRTSGKKNVFEAIQTLDDFTGGLPEDSAKAVSNLLVAVTKDAAARGSKKAVGSGVMGKRIKTILEKMDDGISPSATEEIAIQDTILSAIPRTATEYGMPKTLSKALRFPEDKTLRREALKFLKDSGAPRELRDSFFKSMRNRLNLRKIPNQNTMNEYLANVNAPKEVMTKIAVIEKMIPGMKQVLNETRISKFVQSPAFKKLLKGERREGLAGLGFLSLEAIPLVGDSIPNYVSYPLAIMMFAKSLKNPVEYSLMLKRLGVKATNAANASNAAYATREYSKILPQIATILGGKFDGGN